MLASQQGSFRYELTRNRYSIYIIFDWIYDDVWFLIIPAKDIIDGPHNNEEEIDQLMSDNQNLV